MQISTTYSLSHTLHVDSQCTCMWSLPTRQAPKNLTHEGRNREETRVSINIVGLCNNIKSCCVWSKIANSWMWRRECRGLVKTLSLSLYINILGEHIWANRAWESVLFNVSFYFSAFLFVFSSSPLIHGNDLERN